MLRIDVRHNFDNLVKSLKAKESQIPFATARALTKTAQDIKAAEGKEIARVFDRPTPYTRNSVYMRPATKQRLQAEVWLKDSKRPEHYLLPQIKGASRPLKRFEERLVKTGYLNSTERLVPTNAIGRDQYGNVSRGTITKVLSQLRTAVVSGDFSNASNSARSKSKRSVEQYFWSAGPGSTHTYVRQSVNAQGRVSLTSVTAKQHLPKGVWMVRRTAFGNAVRPVFLAVSGAQYRAIFDFYGLAQRVHGQRFNVHFAESIAAAMRTARLSTQTTLF